jgi:cellulose synthase/poly-beta-1,6-N-acetylglucosamine synthase-like glycosyltransferase
VAPAPTPWAAEACGVRGAASFVEGGGIGTVRTQLVKLLEGSLTVSGQPLVSVIMIFLNGERFIEEAIASVFAQTRPHWELLLVDDGSRDRSTAIAKAWAERHPERVRYLQVAGG